MRGGVRVRRWRSGLWDCRCCQVYSFTAWRKEFLLLKLHCLSFQQIVLRLVEVKEKECEVIYFRSSFDAFFFFFMNIICSSLLFCGPKLTDVQLNNIHWNVTECPGLLAWQLSCFVVLWLAYLLRTKWFPLCFCWVALFFLPSFLYQ